MTLELNGGNLASWMFTAWTTLLETLLREQLGA